MSNSGSDPELCFLEKPKRVVFQDHFAALVDHLVGEAHQAAIALGGEAVLDYLALDVEGVAHDCGPLYVERAVEEREARVLHRRQEQAFGKRIHQGSRYCTAFYGSFRIIGYGEELFGEPGEVDERRGVGFADGAPVGAEAESRLQVLEGEAPADNQGHFLFLSKLRWARSNASRMLFIEASAPRIISVQASVEADCRRRSSAMASSLLRRKPSSWRSYSAFMPAWALRMRSSQRAASAFHASICVLSFCTYSSRFIMAGSLARDCGILARVNHLEIRLKRFVPALALAAAGSAP